MLLHWGGHRTQPSGGQPIKWAGDPPSCFKGIALCLFNISAKLQRLILDIGGTDKARAVEEDVQALTD